MFLKMFNDANSEEKEKYAPVVQHIKRKKKYQYNKTNNALVNYK